MKTPCKISLAQVNQQAWTDLLELLAEQVASEYLSAQAIPPEPKQQETSTI